jgi:hypothetical protein
MDIDFIKWLISRDHYRPIFAIDFENPDWEQINFEVQSQLSANELYYLSQKYDY